MTPPKKPEELKKRGRPSAYKPEFCAIVEELGAQGKSITQISCDPRIDVSVVTLNAWAKEFPEFLASITRAREKAQTWFEDKGQDGLELQGFNGGLWAKMVQCRFPNDYRDTSRFEHTGKDGQPIEQKVTQVNEGQVRLILDKFDKEY